MYYNTQGHQIEKSRWDLHQTSYYSKSGLEAHGIYQGSGSVTYTGYDDYDFETFSPIDEADAIAYQHDKDYAKYAGNINYVEDVRTRFADKRMLARIGYQFTVILTTNDFFGVLQVNQIVENKWKCTSFLIDKLKTIDLERIERS